MCKEYFLYLLLGKEHLPRRL